MAQFEFDDEERKPAPPTPKAPAPGGGAGGFNAFVDVKVDASLTGTSTNPGGVKGGTPVAPGAASVAPGAPASPPPVPVGDPADADVVPGSGRDLWKCPHCGAGNKPSRTTCRSCGKSPEEPVVVPWHRKPAVLAGIVVGSILLLALIMTLGRADLSLKPAGPASVDARPRTGGGGTEQMLDGRQWYGKRRYAVSGRIAAVRPLAEVPGVLNVVLVLGRDANNDEAFSSLKVVLEGQRIDERENPRRVPWRGLHLLFREGAPALAPGQYLSLVGQGGVLSEDGTKIRALDDVHDTVLVDDYATAGP